MAGYDDGDDFFDDDSLDALPADALEELEHNAIQFTQAQTQAARKTVAPSSDYGDDFEDEDLDDAVLIDKSRSTPALVLPLQRNRLDVVSQHEQFRQQRHGSISRPNLTNRQPPDPPKFSEPSRPVPVSMIRLANGAVDSPSCSWTAVTAVEDPQTLMLRIEELTRQNAKLLENDQAKSGEIAILRTNYQKSIEDKSREINSKFKQRDDELAKKQKALDLLLAEKNHVATELDFIRRDNEENQRTSRLNKAREAGKKGAVVTTPQKKKNRPHGDGFDDAEIEFTSPSKRSPSKLQRSKHGTPTKGKRKRRAAESPAGALEVIRPEEPDDAGPGPKFALLDEAPIPRLEVQDDRFDFIGTMFDHRMDANHLRTLEEFGKHALPSAPLVSFQSIVLSKLPTFAYQKHPKDLATGFCELLLTLWDGCVKEKYIAPLPLILDMLTLALETKTTTIAPSLIDSLVPLAQLTADLVAIPRFHSQAPEPWAKDIDVSACMSILHITALGCMPYQEDIARFWRLMRWDFVLVILSTNQVIEDYNAMLQILSTSVLRESFGTISREDNLKTAGYILTRLTYPLFEVPCLPMTTEKFKAGPLSKLRLAILQLMTSMTRSAYASKAIAMHDEAIGRLVSLMSDELDVLYDYKSDHEDSARIVSMIIRLLYHLVTKYDDIIDMQKRLSKIRGGSQKYLICLSRLNFSEDDLVIESGLDGDVATCALEMLELVVTPEEGDAIQSAFTIP